MPRGKKEKAPKLVVSVKHSGNKRVGIPTVEEGTLLDKSMRIALTPTTLKYPRNPDLDPQLVWKGKDEQDSAPLTVKAFPIYIQEKIHPQTLIKELMDESKARAKPTDEQLDFFADFNGVPPGVDRTDFYHYEKNWTNRMILGDSLQVMASLAEKEGLRGKVQCIYLDPPYGIKFNSNFQWSTTSTAEKDGKDITREPEMVKAFRDTWRYGINSYLSYLRDRLVLARDLLADTGSIFVQIGDENVALVRCLLDEVFGCDNFETMITYASTSGLGGDELPKATNYILWFSKNHKQRKYRAILKVKEFGGEGSSAYSKLEFANGTKTSISEYEKLVKKTFTLDIAPFGSRIFALDNITSSNHGQGVGDTGFRSFTFMGKERSPGKGCFKTHQNGMQRLAKANRLGTTDNKLGYVRYFDDFLGYPLNNIWTDTLGQNQFGGDKVYVVQTGLSIVRRCLLMVTDPGDLVLDPTCGSGTTAYVAEQWGRRWITIDTSRVALALARARLMGARYPYYLLADSEEGQKKEAEICRRLPSTAPTTGDIRRGFVYERVPHITLKSIANNTEIDTIWEKYEKRSSELRQTLGIDEEWQVPRPDEPAAKKLPKDALGKFWELHKARQAEIDKSIAAKAEFEYLYDKPYVDNSKVRVAGPFTVESLDPHRVMSIGPDGELVDPVVLQQTNDLKAAADALDGTKPMADFAAMILENLKMAGVQQAAKADRIDFTSLEPVPGTYVCAEGRYSRGEKQIRAGIFIGPEFGTVTRAELADAAREASERGFDELISCAFNYDARAADLIKGGIKYIPVLQARINADLHMAGELKNTGKGNLFVVFGEPDIAITKTAEGKLVVEVKGVDIFKPQSGKVESSGPDDIACWFIDTNYNNESFFIRQAYFLGQPDPYNALKTTLKAEIDAEAWASLHSAKSRPFDPPASGFIAVKVINHLGDEVLKVYDGKSWK